MGVELDPRSAQKASSRVRSSLYTRKRLIKPVEHSLMEETASECFTMTARSPRKSETNQILRTTQSIK